MRRIVCVLLILLQAEGLFAQSEEVLRAARYLSGASSEEEAEEYWVSRLEAAEGRRIRINDRHLRSEGILSDYQIASLADYRSRSGDILSWEELALVDGFSRELVAVLRPFISLESARLPGATDTARIRGYSFIRGSLTGVGGKLRLEGSRWRAGAAWRSSGWPFGRTSDGTFHAEGSWRGHRLLLGDFNLRFGQGIAFWSGFSMASLSTVEAFVRRTTGLSPVWSFSASSIYRGAAYEYRSEHWRAHAFASLSGMSGGHAEWLGRYGQAGVTLGWQKEGGWSVSADTRWNIRGSDLVAEFACRNGSPAGMASFRRSFGTVKAAIQGRALPSRFSGKKYGEYALAGGLSYQSEKWKPLSGQSGFGSSVPEHKASITLDAALLPIPGADPRRLQIRAYAGWQWQFDSAWSLDVRLTERYRNYENPRTDLRADVKFLSGSWRAAVRVEGVHCERFGFLNYWEAGWAPPKASGIWNAVSAYLRLTAFVIDRWNDRIYVYERDAPGNFSVPAYSGRGASLAAVGSWKHRFSRCSLKAFLRAGWTVRIGRVPSPVLALQFHLDL